MENKNKIKLNENAISYIKKKMLDGFNSVKRLTSSEYKETLAAGNILKRIIQNQDATSEEIDFLKEQSIDVLKTLGIIGVGSITSIPLILGLGVILKKKGINILPTQHDIPDRPDPEQEKELHKIAEEVHRKIVGRMNEAETRAPLDMPVPKDLLELKSFFDKKNFDFYIVGGAVRDALSGDVPKDYDIVTNATPKQMESFIPRATRGEIEINGGSPPKGKYVFIEAGNIFPVVHLKTSEGGIYEVATYREDHGDDHRKPETTFSTINQDANRRDLTINALYYDIDSKEVIDFVGGIEDLKNGIVRTVGDPQQRFDENRIRVLRAIRFAARTETELHDDIKTALRNDAGLQREAGEAIMTEFLKGIKQAKDVSHYLSLVYEYGVIDWVFPSVKMDPSNIINEKDPAVLFAHLFKGHDARGVGKRLINNFKYSKPFSRQVSFLMQFSEFAPANVSKLKNAQKISQVTPEQITRFAKVSGMDPKLAAAFNQFENTESGDDFSHLKGAEIGLAVADAEAKNFEDIYKKL